MPSYTMTWGRWLSLASTATVANHSLGTHLVATDTPRATSRWTAQVRALSFLTVRISTTTQWPCYSQLQTIHLLAQGRGTHMMTVAYSSAESTVQMAAGGRTKNRRCTKDGAGDNP